MQLCQYFLYDKILFIKKYGSLVKWFNTLPSQGSIHGSEPHTSHHNEIKRLLVVFFIKKTASKKFESSLIIAII